MAAPQVAGSLALVASAHPSLRKHPGALIARLKRLANDGPQQLHPGPVGDRHLAG